MTRSVTIVNTSNWDGEDWEVVAKNPNNPDADPEVTRIRPGESCMVNPAYEDVSFRAVDDGNKPFHLTGVERDHKTPNIGRISGRGQVFPFVVSGVGHVEQVREG